MENLSIICIFNKLIAIVRTVLEREKKSYSSDKVQVMNQNTK